MSENLKRKTNAGKFLLYFVIFSTIVLDQLAKFLALKFLPTVCNRGIAFGIKLGEVEILISVGVLILVAYFLLRSKATLESGLEKFGLALIFAGGLSNIVDRLLRGCVVDFVDFKFWPAFNLADSAVVFGVLILLYSLFKKKSI